jgi:hypothetical protein
MIAPPVAEKSAGPARLGPATKNLPNWGDYGLGISSEQLSAYRAGKRTIFAAAPECPELWVLTRVVDDSDENWDESLMIVGSPAQIAAMGIDLTHGVPQGWRVLKGVDALEYLAEAEREEQRYRAEQAAQKRRYGLN